MESELPSVAEVRRDHDDRHRNPKYTQEWYDNYQQGIIDRREAKKAETARRNLLKRTAKAKGILPSFRKMLERPGFGICTKCLTEKPEEEMQRPALCRTCQLEYYRAYSQQKYFEKYGPPRIKLTTEELAERAKARWKARSKTKMSLGDFRDWIAARKSFLDTTKKMWFKKTSRKPYIVHRPIDESPKQYITTNGKRFDTEFERDEYVRGWREYYEWCAENREAIKRAARDRENRARLLKKAIAAGFSTIDEYQSWIATKPHPLAKSEEHHAERRRIRDQWRNYRKQVKAGMAANGGRIPSGWFAAQLHRQSHCCAICGHPFGDGDVEIDHIVPVAKGGPNVAWNLQLTHPVCNTIKSDLMPWELPEAA